ncbi:hypothetical protein [Methylobacterium sp. A54F]
MKSAFAFSGIVGALAFTCDVSSCNRRTSRRRSSAAANPRQPRGLEDPARLTRTTGIGVPTVEEVASAGRGDELPAEKTRLRLSMHVEDFVCSLSYQARVQTRSAMMWATRLVQPEEMASIKELFTDQSAALGAPRDMMLLEVREEAGGIRLYVGVPEAEMLSSYFGFAPCLKRDLPKAPALIAGDRAVFQAMFQAGG